MEMNLQKYLALAKSVEYGSFTRAAEALNYSQSGISHMILDLEKEWNVTLLERRHGGVKLTSDGLRLMPYVRRLCEDFEQISQQVDNLNGLQTGLIRIGVFSSVASQWLPNIVMAFRRDYPGIRYEFVEGGYEEITRWILDGSVDCGFVIAPFDKGLDVTLMGEDVVQVLLPPDHPLAAKEVVPLEELKGEPIILMEDGNAIISHLLEKSGLLPDVWYITVDDAALAMVEKGLAVCFLPELANRRIAYNVAVRNLDIRSVRQIGFAIRDRKTAPLAVRRFMDYLKFRDGDAGGTEEETAKPAE